MLGFPRRPHLLQYLEHVPLEREQREPVADARMLRRGVTIGAPLGERWETGREQGGACGAMARRSTIRDPATHLGGEVRRDLEHLVARDDEDLPPTITVRSISKLRYGD